MTPNALEARDAALLDVLARLAQAGYRFVTPNKSTHGLVRERSRAGATDALRDVFGWVRPFEPRLLPASLMAALRGADALEESPEGPRVRVRVSTIGDLLFAHTAPTTRNDAVFLGPDSYRFARFLAQCLAGSSAGPVARALDLGCGAGVGALTLARLGAARSIVASDVNPEALRLTRINAAQGGFRIETRLCSGPPPGEAFDLIVANPPFIAGDTGKTYRDGGDLHGAALSIDWAARSLASLSPGGRLLLYTGAPVVAGVDVVERSLRELAARTGARLRYEEIDPDIFGSSLRREAYRDVERIAAIGAVLAAP